MLSTQATNLTLLVTILSILNLATAQIPPPPPPCPSTVASVMVLSKNGTTLSGPLNCTSLAGKFNGDEAVSPAANYISFLMINDKATCMNGACSANCTIQSTNAKADDAVEMSKAEQDAKSFCTELGGQYITLPSS